MPYFDTSAQLAAKVETTEGTAETLAGTDVDVRIYDSGKDLAINQNERDPKDSDQEQGPISGARSITLRAQTHLHGYGDEETEPGFATLLRAGALRQSANRLVLCTCTAGSSDTVPIGTLLDDGSNYAYLVWQSGDKSKALLWPYDGDTVGAATWQNAGDTLDVVVASVVADAGWVWHATPPNLLNDNTAVPSITARLTETAKRFEAVGARCGLTMTLGHREIGLLDVEIMGKYSRAADGAELTPSPALPDITPRVCMDHLELTPSGGSQITPILSAITVNINNSLELRQSISEDTGYLSTAIGSQEIQISMDPEEYAEATIDWSQVLQNNTALSLGGWWGSETSGAAGLCGFYADELILNDAGEGTRDTIRTRSLTGKCAGDYNVSFLFWVGYPDAS
jgi:hypothetical protein